MDNYTIEVRNVLAVLSSHEESASLRRALSGADWTLSFASTLPDVEAALRVSAIGVVICGCHLAGGHGWKDLLNQVQKLPLPPQVIVADRLADDALWAEALNLGCYDLLATPFATTEVSRVVSMAWEFWKRETGRATARPKPPASARASDWSAGGTLAAGAN